jgi:UDPglucose--hexose-1-phosphate uridylyltransferase
MLENELRKDYLLNRWVVIAKNRKKRPTDFIRKKNIINESICPLCLNNEQMTPPAVLVYLPANGKPRKEKDENDFRHKNWLVRVIPNLYPAFIPPTNQDKLITDNPTPLKAIGHHEVVVESPRHTEHPSVASISQLVHVINIYLDRLNVLSRKVYVKHVTIFRNHGQEAGASLSHPHTQIIASPIIPSLVENELESSKKYWNIHKECVFCDILQREAEGSRFIYENQSFIVFAPYASINPLEFWILPKSHNSSMLSLSKNQILDLAKTMRICFGGLRTLLNDPPYNFGFHTIINENVKNFYHWHLEVYPRLATWAGFEKSTCMFINIISPEDAAIELRSAIQVEEKALIK